MSSIIENLHTSNLMQSSCAQNWQGIGVAAIASQVFGAIYYSKLGLLPLWCKHSQRSSKSSPGPPTMLLALTFNLLAAVVLSKVIGNPTSIVAAMIRGLIVGMGLNATALLHNSVFTNDSRITALIDGSYETIKCGIMATILYLFNSHTFHK